MPEPFKISVPDTEIRDLKRRLAADTLAVGSVRLGLAVWVESGLYAGTLRLLAQLV